MLGIIYRMQGGEYSSGSRNKSFQQATLTSWYSLLYPYFDEMSDIRTDITLCLKEFPRAKPEGTPEVYHLNNHKANVYLIILIDN